MFFQILRNRLFQSFDTLECAPSDGFVGDLGEEVLDMIPPRRIGRREVDDVAGMPQQPAFHAGRFVSPVVVHDEVNAHAVLLGNGLFDGVQELDELLLSMLAEALADDLTCGNIQGGAVVRGGGAVRGLGIDGGEVGLPRLQGGADGAEDSEGGGHGADGDQGSGQGVPNQIVVAFVAEFGR